jgi:tetratricopeptide (TPR) repeat protein
MRIRGDEESLSLSRELGDLQGVARALHELGEAALAEEEFDTAVELFREAVAAGRAAGHNGAGSIGNIGYVELLRGDYEQASDLSEQATQLFRERGHQSGVAVGLATQADAVFFLGRTEEARLRIRECLDLGAKLGFKEVIASGLETSAALLADRNK